MFHYRLAPQNNRSRMLIAVFMAVALHMGFMDVEFGPEKVSIPIVSLPHSVSVFLGQKNMDEKPEQQNINAQPAKPLIDDQSVKTKPEKNVSPESSAVPEKKDNTAQQPVMSEQTVKPASNITEEKIPPAAEIMSVNQTVENIKTEDYATTIHETVSADKPQTVQMENGVPRPGTLQMAYPRYHLNTPPPYPGLARKRAQEGTVVLQVLVNRQGRVDDLRIDVSSNFSLLDRAAVKAVRKWSFEPGKKGEDRVSMWVKVPVTFQLKE